ncbi:MAG: c-type cytochrome [Sinobacteraceae bacterium]|nr:c-type cytochrome [Nevskiaceae bacterium]
MSEEKDLSDGAFIRRFSVVIGGLCVIILISFIVAGVMSYGQDDHPKAAKALLAQQLTPVASAATSAQAAAPASAAGSSKSAKALSGKQVVANVCSACHGSGMLGAPKIGDSADWGKRFKTQGGLDGLEKHAIHGLGNMPPRGGDSSLSDQEIHDAIKYMLSKSGVSG